MTTDAVFELERFTAAPVNDDVALLEVDGRFAEGTLGQSAPLLLVENGEQTLEIAPLAPEQGSRGRWHASFAVPARHLEATFALALDDVLLDLPAPDGSAGDRMVALARELNALRRRLDEAERRARDAEDRVEASTTEAARGAEAAAAAAREEKDTALARSAERMETALREAAAGREAALQELRERAKADLGRAQSAHDKKIKDTAQALAAAREELGAQRSRAEQAESERDHLSAEIRETRRGLKAARAETEALRRERDGMERELRTAMRAVPRGRTVEVDGQPVDDADAEVTAGAPTVDEATVADDPAAASELADVTTEANVTAPESDDDDDSSAQAPTAVGATADTDPAPDAPTSVREATAPRPAERRVRRPSVRIGDTEFDTYEDPGADGGVERVRVLGRQGPRRVSPADVLPPVDNEIEPAPPVLSYVVAAVIFVIFVVVFTLLVI